MASSSKRCLKNDFHPGKDEPTAKRMDRNSDPGTYSSDKFPKVKTIPYTTPEILVRCGSDKVVHSNNAFDLQPTKFRAHNTQKESPWYEVSWLSADTLPCPNEKILQQSFIAELTEITKNLTLCEGKWESEANATNDCFFWEVITAFLSDWHNASGRIAMERLLEKAFQGINISDNIRVLNIGGDSPADSNVRRISFLVDYQDSNSSQESTKSSPENTPPKCTTRKRPLEDSTCIDTEFVTDFDKTLVCDVLVQKQHRKAETGIPEKQDILVCSIKSGEILQSGMNQIAFEMLPNMCDRDSSTGIIISPLKAFVMRYEKEDNEIKFLRKQFKFTDRDSFSTNFIDMFQYAVYYALN